MALTVHTYACARRKTRAPNRNSPVSTTYLHPLAQEAVLFLADGDPSRLRIISPAVVLVLNHPRGRRYPRG
jgi:predicted RNA-binding Zn ribbon-like protein